MPGPNRMKSGGHWAGLRRRGFRTCVLAVLIIITGETGAAARPVIPILLDAFAQMERHEIAGLALTLGVIVFAVITSILLVRTRARAAEADASARAEIAALRAEADRARTLMLAEPQFVVQWPAGEAEPDIVGDTAIVTALGKRRALAFGTWLSPEQAKAIERSIECLRSRGESFSMPMTTLTGRYVEAEGRAIGGRAVLRVRDVTGTTRELAALAARHQSVLREFDALRMLIETLPSPIWTREASGRLSFVNRAYAHAVDAKDSEEAVARGLELLDQSAREDRRIRHAAGKPFSARIPVIVAGRRAMFDVLDLPAEAGSAGIGLDATEAHRRTLDQLPIAVAVFNAGRRLTFYNAAYATLWGLGADILDDEPTDAELLERLRAARKLPEQVNFRQWIGQLHEAYRAIEPREHLWHLPDGRTLRAITTPNPEGGVTYLFDDVSESLELERRYDALIRVQRETLDNLSEAVVVFGSDGRLRLHNPAFAKMWRLPAAIEERAHIEIVAGLCCTSQNDAAIWQELHRAVTGLDQRDALSGRFERHDGCVVDYATVPLPDGATLLAFQDVTDSVNVERALRERNEALETAHQLKNDFVHHVSYELRSPLTDIIGFAQLLDDESIGPLNSKQRDYIGHITSSSAALLAIINDILDLSKIESGRLEVEQIACVPHEIVREVVKVLNVKAQEKNIALTCAVDTPIPETILSDPSRLRQIVTNLVGNALKFTQRGGVRVVLRMDSSGPNPLLAIDVVDSGIGIPHDKLDAIFRPFEQADSSTISPLQPSPRRGSHPHACCKVYAAAV